MSETKTDRHPCFYCGCPVPQTGWDYMAAVYYCGCEEGRSMIDELYERAEIERALVEQLEDMHRW